MADRVATLELLYTSDLSKARAEYNAYKQWVEENAPVLRFKTEGGTPGAAGPAGTFGGGTTATGAGSIPTAAAAAIAEATRTKFGAPSMDSPSLIADRAAFSASQYGSGRFNAPQGPTSGLAQMAGQPVAAGWPGGWQAWGAPGTAPQGYVPTQALMAAAPVQAAAAAQAASAMQPIYANRTRIAGVPVNPNAQIQGPRLASGAFNTQDEPEGEPGGRRSFLGRTSGLTRRFGAGYVAYEALRIGQAYIAEQDQLRFNAGNLPGQLKARLEFNQTLESFPVAGQVASIYSRGLERLPFFGGAHPGDTPTAVFNAQESLKDVLAGSQRVQSSNLAQAASRSLLNQGIESSTVGTLTKRRESIFSEYDQGVAQRDMQERNLQEQINAEADVRESNRMSLQLAQMRRDDRKVLLPAMIFNRDSGLGELSREVGYRTTSLSRRQSEIESMTSGQFGAAEERGFENQLQDRLDRAGEIERPLVTRENQLDRAERRAKQDEQLRRDQAGNVAGQFELEHNPLSARLADIDEQRRQAIGGAALRPIDPNALAAATAKGVEISRYSGMGQVNPNYQVLQDLKFNNATLAAINTKFNIASAQATVDDQVSRFRIGQSTRRIEDATREQDLRNQYKPRTANVAGIISGGVSAIEETNVELRGSDYDEERQRRVESIRRNALSSVYGATHPQTQGEFVETSAFVTRGNPGDLRYRDVVAARRLGAGAGGALDAARAHPLPFPGAFGFAGGPGPPAMAAASAAAAMAGATSAGASGSGRAASHSKPPTEEQEQQVINLLTQLLNAVQQQNAG